MEPNIDGDDPNVEELDGPKTDEDGFEPNAEVDCDVKREGDAVNDGPKGFAVVEVPKPEEPNVEDDVPNPVLAKGEGFPANGLDDAGVENELDAAGMENGLDGAGVGN